VGPWRRRGGAWRRLFPPSPLSLWRVLICPRCSIFLYFSFFSKNIFEERNLFLDNIK